jgi:excisionase family DNA binding protein
MKKPSEIITPRYLSIREASQYLSIHPETMRRLSASGSIKPVVMPASGTRLFLRYDIKDLDRFMELRKQSL